MNTVGIVSEYNPFHNGHLYQIEESRKALGQDAVVICVMSGDFVQRGEAAVFSKFSRAEAACRCGADIVVELPLPWCLSTAETFASGAVDILASMGCTHISFGSEYGDVSALCELADFLLDDSVRTGITELLRNDKTLSYVRARQNVIKEFRPQYADLLDNANNILAVEYIKAIKKNHPELIPFTVKRIGSGHDKTGNEGPKSASEIREMLLKGESTAGLIPPEAQKVFNKEKEEGRLGDPEIMEMALRSRLLMFDEEYYETLPDASDGAGRRLYKAIRSECSLSDAVNSASSKIYTLSRMRRMLLCAALGISAEYTKAAPPYTRLLAVSKNGREYLKKIQKEYRIPLITKPASVRFLDEKCINVFALGASAHDLYSMQFMTKNDRLPGEDWRKGPTVV